MSTGPARSIDNDRIYQSIRSEIQYEQSLINARVNWLIASQAFLFLPLAMSLDPGKEGAGAADSIFFPFIPYLGMILCLLTTVAVVGATWRITQWRRKCGAGAYSGEGEHATFSIVQPRTSAIPLMGHVASVGIPLVLTLAWVFVRVWPPD